MSVSNKGSHLEMPQEMPTPDAVGTEKKVLQEAALVGRALQVLPEDIVTEDEDEVFEDAFNVGKVFFLT